MTEEFANKALMELEVAERERWKKVEPLIEVIALKAAYMSEFETVSKAESPGAALQMVQALLASLLQEELGRLSEPAVAGVPSNQFKVAKEVVKLLWKDPKKQA